MVSLVLLAILRAPVRARSPLGQVVRDGCLRVAARLDARFDGEAELLFAEWNERLEHLPGKLTKFIFAMGMLCRVAIARLSGGQRQRVSIARALAARPDVLVCDEVTSALDPDTAEAIIRLLGALQAERGLGLVVVSHDLSLISRHCDRTLVLVDGRVTAPGLTVDVLAWCHPSL